jgi:hypothetical protein
VLTASARRVTEDQAGAGRRSRPRAGRYLVIFVVAVAVLLLVRGSGVMLVTSA